MSLIREMESVVVEVVQDEVQAREVVARILRRFGGGAVYLPAEHYEARNAAIRELVTAGADITVVAARYKLHPVTVNRICKPVREQLPQKRRGRKPKVNARDK